MTNWLEDVPEELHDAGKKEEFIAWLFEIPIPKKTKKYILVSWIQFFGFTLTREDVERSGAEP